MSSGAISYSVMVIGALDESCGLEVHGDRGDRCSSGYVPIEVDGVSGDEFHGLRGIPRVDIAVDDEIVELVPDIDLKRRSIGPLNGDVVALEVSFSGRHPDLLGPYFDDVRPGNVQVVPAERPDDEAGVSQGAHVRSGACTRPARGLRRPRRTWSCLLRGLRSPRARRVQAPDLTWAPWETPASSSGRSAGTTCTFPGRTSSK